MQDGICKGMKNTENHNFVDKYETYSYLNLKIIKSKDNFSYGKMLEPTESHWRGLK